MKSFLFERASRISFHSAIVFVLLLMAVQARSQTIPNIPQQSTAVPQTQAPVPGNTTITDQSKNRTVVVDDPRAKAKQDSVRLLRIQDDSQVTAVEKLRIFGADIFTNKSLDFVPVTNIATPKGYILGAGDQLILNLYGTQFKDVSITQRITPEGTILIPQVGPVFLAGMTIEAATERLYGKLSNIYPLGRGMDLSVRIGDIRSIRINFVGEVVNPGTFTLPSLATVMNALYFSGGPTESGSFRMINLIRRNKFGQDSVIRRIDLYQYLTKGLRNSDISLRDDDVIQIPPYKSRIEMVAGTKKTGYFELLPGENLGNLLDFAGGFVADAYRNVITIQRITDNGRKFLDVASNEVRAFELQNGDRIGITKVPERQINMVAITGPVYMPGSYPLDRNPTVKDLIKRAEGPKPEAFLGRASIYRQKDDMTVELIPVNLARVLADKDTNVALKPLDRLEILNVTKLREGLSVRILGEIGNVHADTNKGYFPWFEGMTVEDLIIQAGNLKASASPNYIEVVRPKHLDSDDPKDINSILGERFNFAISKDLRLTEAASRFKLRPYDIVYIRASPNFEENQSVSIEGEVIKRGDYSLIDRDERISDLVSRAGGMTPYAFVEGASLLRRVKQTKTQLEQQQRTVNEIAGNTKKSVVNADVLIKDTQEAIGIDLRKILAKPHSDIDLVLQDGDVLSIPKHNPTVRVEGEVQLPATTRFTRGVGLGEYISRAGGFTSRSVRKRTYVVYANGFAKKTKHFLFFNSYPEIRPGARIVVPTRTVADITSQQVIGSIGQVGTALSGLLGIYAILRTLR